MTFTSVSRSLAAVAVVATLAACSHGSSSTTTAAAPAPARNTPANPTSSAARRGLPNGVTALMVAEGDSIFHARGCKNCHGADASGAANGPSLKTGTFMHIDGSFDSFVNIITNGVPAAEIKDPAHKIPMPGHGGRPTPLTDTQIRSVAAYVYSLNHQG